MTEEGEASRIATLRETVDAIAASRDQYRDQVARLQGQVEALENVVRMLFDRRESGPYG